jgi:L-rhamnose mutarotase
MSERKKTYINSSNKHAVREFIIQRFQFESVVGLAGPDINEYLAYLEAKGCKEFEIYETNSEVALQQLSKIRSKSKIALICSDILNANPDKQNVLFDLDFCASVRFLKEHIAKFQKNFIMTFSTRIGVQETIDTFFKSRKEKVLHSIDYLSPMPHTIYKTKKGNYLFIKYFDTSAMCCFAKI